MGRGRALVPAVLAAVAIGALAGPARGAESLYAVTNEGRLINFASDSPGTILSSNRITGLPDGEVIEAIDFRPATGGLYGLGRSSRVYTIATGTGSAAPVAPDRFDPSLAGRSFGFDFNPVVDRIRVVSDANQNLRLNPDDGRVAAVDRNLMYDPARYEPDAHAFPPGDPTVVAAAYTNNRKGATSTRLYGMDAAHDSIVLQDPPNDGTLVRTTSVGADVPETVGFDIAADGTAYAAFRVGGGPAELFSLDLQRGILHPPQRSRAPVIVGDGREVLGLAAAGQIPDDRAGPDVLVDAERTVTKRALRKVGYALDASCSEACELRATLTRKNRELGIARATLARPGVARMRVLLNAAGRKEVARRGRRSLVLDIGATDQAGNATRMRRGVVAR
jgi:hypothetical protein